MEQTWNPKSRTEHRSLAQTQTFDLIIIGGGITGAGVAREAALRGLSFCLADKNDFAFGTSSRSSKLAHGGIRYLSSREFKLVRESATERNWLRAHFPNLVRPLGFLFNAFEHGHDRPAHVILSLIIYDFLSNYRSPFKNYRHFRFFSRAFIEEFEPAYSTRDPQLGALKISGFYYDTNIDDARLTVETIKDSLQRSTVPSVALNYTAVEGFLKNEAGRVIGVAAHDILDDTRYEIRGKAVVACGGIWSDEILKHTAFGAEKIFPTKGVHIVVPNERLGNRNGLGLRSFDDNRFFFVLRRGKVSLIGTTDTDYYQESHNLDEPWCTKEDCDYLLHTVNRMFPHARLTYDDIIGTYAGIRPLIKQEGAANASAVSREHAIFASPDGVVAIAGGKLTTFRSMAEEVLFYLVDHGYLPPFTDPTHHQPGFSKVPFTVGMTRAAFDREIATRGLAECATPDQLEYLHQQYGRQALMILDRIKENPSLGEPLLEGYPHCRAEIDFILEHENAPHLIDILCRRTEAQWMIWHQLQPVLAKAVAAIMAEYYGWTKKRTRAEIDAYLAYVRKTVAFIGSESVTTKA